MIIALHTYDRQFITDTDNLPYYDTSPPPVVRWGRRYFVMSVSGGKPLYLDRNDNLDTGKPTRAVEYVEVWGLTVSAVEPSDYDTNMPNPMRPYNVGENDGDANIVSNLRRQHGDKVKILTDEKLAEAWSDYSGHITGDHEADNAGFLETIRWYTPK